jgi:hypothetical protein
MEACFIPVVIAYANSTYPIALGVVLTELATPSFPGAPIPTGHSIDLPFPICCSHVELTLERKSVQTYVVPEPSDLWTTTISSAGRDRPEFID